MRRFWQDIIYKSLIPTFCSFGSLVCLLKVGTKTESLVFTRARILFLVPYFLEHCRLVDPFDPYSPFKFSIFLVNLLEH